MIKTVNGLLLFALLLSLVHCTPVKKEEQTVSNEPQKDSISFCLLNYYEPLSDQQAGGIYEEYASYIAEKLGKAPKFVYLNSAYFNRPVRDGIRKGICDCQMGHPIEEEEPWLIPKKVRQSTAYTSIGYAIATADPAITKLEDLNGKTVIVMSQSPPLSTVGDLDSVRIRLMINEPKMMEQLNAGEVDAVVAWGPKLYHLNQENYGGKFKVFDTPYMWKVAILTQAKDETLMQSINTIIKESPERYRNIAGAYGL